MQFRLETEQVDLLLSMVEASWNVPRASRQPFFGIGQLGGPDTLHHPGLDGGEMDAYRGDLDALAEAGLVRGRRNSAGGLLYDVTPTGFAYYRELKASLTNAANFAEDAPRFVKSEEFAKAYPSAAERWAAAAADLWAADSERKLTDIGHKCREAMQQFADALFRRLDVAPPTADITKDQSRVLAAANRLAEAAGEKEAAVLQAQAAYWKAVSDLVQRQEHGAQRDGRSLVWEDGRRVVFQTAVVMYEWHRVAKRFRLGVDGTQAP